MTLDEIWSGHRQDLRLVAFRLNTDYYVSLAHHTPEAALKSARVPDADAATADDWDVGEIVSCPVTGQAKDVIHKADRGKNRSQGHGRGCKRVADWGPNREKGADRFEAQDTKEAEEVEMIRVAAETECAAREAEQAAEGKK